MRLELTEIEGLIQLLLEMLRNRGVESVETKKRDFYWSVLSEDWLDFQTEPSLGVGSLDADFAELKKLLSEDQCPGLVDLERIASVFKLLAEDLAG